MSTMQLIVREDCERARELRASERDQPDRGRADRSRRVEVADFGDLAEPGEIVLSSHSTSEGIVTYLRRRDGTTIVRRWPAP